MRRIVIGIGNPERGDDAAGRETVRRLRATMPADVAIAEADGETTSLLALLDGAAATFWVDACASGAPAGTIRRFDLAEDRLPPTASAVSSHGIGLAEALELARVLGQLPARCVVYAIEGQSFAAGVGLSPAVERAVVEVVQRLCSELAKPMEAACTKSR